MGDVGDFGKYGLLRRITGLTLASDPSSVPPMRLGIHWYLTPDGSGPDGRHIGYLHNRYEYRACDIDLYDKMQELVFTRNERSVSAIERSNLLPAHTTFFSDVLTYEDLAWQGPETKFERLSRRSAWTNKAIETLAEAEVIFLDPDNGVRHDSGEKHKNMAPKYAFEDEIDSFLERGQTVIVYQHLGRPIGGINAFLIETMKRLDGNSLGKLSRPSCCCLFKRFGNRAFIIMPVGIVGEQVVARAEALLRDLSWQRHFVGIRF